MNAGNLGGNMNKAEIIQELTQHACPASAAGMARFGIRSKKVLGVSMPIIRTLARRVGKDHKLAAQLWRSGILEARFLASLIDVPAEVTEAQMESWVSEFDNWAVCDCACSNLLDKTPWAYQKAITWSRRSEEFVKRAGFTMMACLAVHDKRASDDAFLAFFPAIKRESTDERNFVRKAVNWALRQIGKRRPSLRTRAVELAGEIRLIDSKAAKWIAADALRELTRHA